MYVQDNSSPYHRVEDLLKRTGYEIHQENSQRIYFNPANNDNQPPRGCEVFVGRLPRDMLEDMLVPLFERVGPIYKLRLMMDFNGKNRGFCFITYFRKDIANSAVEMFDGFEIRTGCRIGVYKSIDNTRLFVGGIPVNKTKEEVHDAFKEFVEGIREVIMYPSHENEDNNRGYVFMEFENHRYAAIARRRLQPGSLVLWDSQILVDWAEPLPEPDPAIMAKVKKLYCRNISVTLSQDAFQAIIAKYIPYHYLHKVHKMHDFAFLHFVSRGAAEEGLKAIAGIEINGRKLEVTWARPEIYSNNHLRKLEPNHFCLSIPAKIRRVIRMRQNLKKAMSTSPSPQNMIMGNIMYAPNHQPIMMPVPQPIPHPIAFHPNYIMHLQENGLLM